MTKTNHFRNMSRVAYLLLIALLLGGILIYFFIYGDKTIALPGETTIGHHQIEASCEACHLPFKGVAQEACIDCHGQALTAFLDSHPGSKFDDPKNAAFLKILDARQCTTCHQEHRPEITDSMGVTIPKDFCVQCHAEIVKKSPSHNEFPFNTCSTSGCHNYHDNTSLNEDVLVYSLGEPDLSDEPVVPLKNLIENYYKRTGSLIQSIDIVSHDSPEDIQSQPQLLNDGGNSTHAKAGVRCSGCHSSESSSAQKWTTPLDQTACSRCHNNEVNGFLSGMHGMRLAQNMTPMKVNMARLPMKENAHDKELNCTSCHGAHAFDVKKAGLEACLSCHNDQHSLAYRQSPHFQLWQKEQGGDPQYQGKGVSCATCHLPRETHDKDGLKLVRVQHNQNLNLRPNEKMLETVCNYCHGLEFSINALADKKLIQNNFKGSPSIHVKSIQMADEKMMNSF